MKIVSKHKTQSFPTHLYFSSAGELVTEQQDHFLLHLQRGCLTIAPSWAPKLQARPVDQGVSPSTGVQLTRNLPLLQPRDHVTAQSHAAHRRAYTLHHLHSLSKKRYVSQQKAACKLPLDSWFLHSPGPLLSVCPLERDITGVRQRWQGRDQQDTGLSSLKPIGRGFQAPQSDQQKKWRRNSTTVTLCILA